MKNRYVIPTILAAGFAPATATGSDDSSHISADKSLIDDIVHHAQSITGMHEFTLSQHVSHQSHGSHRSHMSHRSYMMPEPPVPNPDLVQGDRSEQLASAEFTGRNEMSTPRHNVLPSSPVTAKKPKVLKGNSAKFGEIVSRVQVSLMTRGYNVGTLSGELDAKTTAALYKYQRENGLPPTGKLESSTLSRLGVVAQ